MSEETQTTSEPTDTRLPQQSADDAAIVPEPELTAADAAPGGRVDLTTQQVFDLLAAGQPVVDARVRRLRMRGRFDRAVKFKNCVLVQPNFDGATFAEDVDFHACQIDRLVSNKATTFEKNVDFGGSTVSRASFARLTVRGKFNAAHTEFRGKTGFNNCEFTNQVMFWEAKFCGWVDFKQCRFKAEADFRSIHADQGMVFTKSHFEHNLLLRGAYVQKKFQADGSWFDARLDLSKAKMFDFVYLEGIGQGPNMTWAFWNAVADRVLVRPDQVEGRLASENDGNHDEAMTEYGLLKRSYQSLHRFDEEDWAFYRFKVNQRRSKATSWRKPWTIWRALGDYLFLDVGCGYGTKPGRAVRMALIIILGFAVLYGAYADQFFTEIKPFDEPKTTLRNRVMIGLTTSVAVFTSGMGGVRDVAEGWLNVPVMVEAIMGTLLFGLFIVAFSRKVIR